MTAWQQAYILTAALASWFGMRNLGSRPSWVDVVGHWFIATAWPISVPLCAALQAWSERRPREPPL